MSCQRCILHGSIGINQSCDIKPNDHYQALYTMKTFPDIQIVKQAVKKGRIHIPTIGIIGTAFRDFLSKWYHFIDFPFVLVINGCDLDFPNHYFKDEKSFIEFVEKGNVKHIFAQNCLVTHPKITHLPIGLDYHTLANGSNSWGPCQSPLEQENNLFAISKQALPFWQRKQLCYSNFHFFFGVSHGSDRKDAIANLPKELIFYEEQRQPRIECWKKQTEFAFVISPHGNGIDCHRTWEALNLGCIVIVKRSKIDAIYKNLPVLIVEEWNQVTSSLLKSTIEAFKKKQFALEKLTLQYWKDLIKSYSKEK